MNTDFLERIKKEAFPGEGEVAGVVKEEAAPLLNYLKLRLLGFGVGATTAGAGTYYGTRNSAMNPIPRGVQVGLNALAGGTALAFPDKLWRDSKSVLEKPYGAYKLLGGASLGYGVDEAIPHGLNLLIQKNKETQSVIDDKLRQAASSAASANFQNTLSKSIPYALGGAGLLGLGAIAANYFKPKSDSSVTVNTPPPVAGGGGGGAPSSGQSREGQLHVKLPVKRQGDHDTSVDIPLSQLNISKTILDRIGRDTRRRLRSETNANTLHRKHLNLEQPSLLN